MLGTFRLYWDNSTLVCSLKMCCDKGDKQVLCYITYTCTKHLLLLRGSRHIQQKLYLPWVFAIFTARKRSLGQGNDFKPVVHSIHGKGCIMSFSVSGPMFLPGGSLSGGLCQEGRGAVSGGGLCQEIPPIVQWTSGWYASYWNAFLLCHFSGNRDFWY